MWKKEKQRKRGQKGRQDRKKRRWNYGRRKLMKEVYKKQLGMEKHRRKYGKWKSTQIE
jgi:hypothetical protein